MSCPFYKGELVEMSPQMVQINCDGNKQYMQTHEGFLLKCDWINYEDCDIYKKKKGYCPFYNGAETYADIRNRNVVKCSKGHIKCFHGEATTNIINVCTGNYAECEKYKEEHKMSELQTTVKGEITESYQRAVRLHAEIMANAEIAANSLTEMCKDLKIMRDEKLYIELGYESFEEYSEQKAGIKSRQAYTYIATYEKLGKDFLQSNANLGITKLEMISQLPFYEKDNFLEKNDVEDMSTRELKEAIEKITKQGEQIDMLNNDLEKLCDEKMDLVTECDALKRQAAELEKIKAERDKALEEKNKADGKAIKLEKEIKELKDKPVDVAVSEPSPEQLEEIRAEAKQKAYDEIRERMVEAEKESKKALAEKAAEIERLKEVAEESEKLKEKLKAANNDKVQEFKIYFADAQDRLTKLFDILQEIDDQGMRIKLGGAFLAFLDTLKADIEGEQNG